MATAPIPTARLLVPDRLQLPPGFATATEVVTNGLPHRVALGELELVFTVPVGLMAQVVAVASDVVVASSEGTFAPAMAMDAGRDPVREGRLRVTARVAGRSTVTAAVVANRVLAVPSAAEVLDVRYEVCCLAWSITAGALRGAGNHGATIEIAWRRADRAVGEFSTPPLPPTLVPRLPPASRTASTLGERVAVDLVRFQVRKKVFRP